MVNWMRERQRWMEKKGGQRWLERVECANGIDIRYIRQWMLVNFFHFIIEAEGSLRGLLSCQSDREEERERGRKTEREDFAPRAAALGRMNFVKIFLPFSSRRGTGLDQKWGRSHANTRQRDETVGGSGIERNDKSSRGSGGT